MQTKLSFMAGIIHIAAFVLAVIGGIMYAGRNMLGWRAGQTRTYYVSERMVWIAGIVLLALGFSLVTPILQSAGDDLFSRLAFTAFLIGAVMLITAEGQGLSAGTWPDFVVRLAVIMLFIGGALFGGSMLASGFAPAWTGWFSLGWNVVWLLVLSRAGDPYYPILFFVAPLVVGIRLLGM